MKRKNSIKIFVTILIIGVLGTFIYKINDIYAVGSYPYAEYYTFNSVTSLDLFNLVKSYKLNNPEYIPPSQLELIDGTEDSTADWFHCYFYIPTNDLLLYTVITKSSDDTTNDIRLVAINQGTAKINWRRINKDLSYQNSKEVMSLFEEKILNHLPLKYNKKGNGLILPCLH